MHDVFIAHIKFNLSSGAQVKPCRGLRTGWVSNHEYRLKGPYIVLSFLLLLFCVLCGVIVNSVLKSRFSIISASGFRKGINKEQIWPGAVRLKIIILRAVIQSWNFADFDLYIGEETSKLRNLGFWQCKKIIMPLIPISCSSVSGCRCCLRCAKRCSLCSAVSCWHLLLRYSRWIWSRRSRSRGFSFHKLQIFISQTTDSHFADYRFSFRFVPFRFANYSKPSKSELSLASKAKGN